MAFGIQGGTKRKKVMEKRKLRKKFDLGACLAVSLVFLLLPFSLALGQIVIDAFTTEQPMIQRWWDPDGNGTEDSTIGPGADEVIGGYRYTWINLTGGTGAVGTRMVATNGDLIFSVDSGAVGGCEVRWTGDVSENAMSLGASFNPNDIFRIVIIDDDLPVLLYLRVFTDAANYSTYTWTLPGGIIDTPTDLYAACNAPDWVATGTGVEWSNVGAIYLGVASTSMLDIRIGLLDLQASELSCVKSFDNHEVNTGDVITATVEIQNTGHAPSGLIDITDTLDAGLSYVAGSALVDGLPNEPAGGPVGPLVWQNLGPIATAANITLTYDISVDSISAKDRLCSYVVVEDHDTQTLYTECEDCVTYHDAPIKEVPTFTQWGMIAFSLLLATSAVWAIQRNRSISDL
ncbi:MAG: hypothetical protein C4B58_08150 [Deltaproteobacteria bacterium]|nr:MAG: hypothetical protein C4B58_08150 [Deltaproteobacteria bacterium]